MAELENQVETIQLADGSIARIEVINAITPNVVTADFNTNQLTDYQTNLNSGKANKKYLHTFQWSPKHHHEEVVEAELSLLLQKNLGKAEVMNDTIRIVQQGGFTVGLYDQEVYINSNDAKMESKLSADGKVSTKIWNLDESVLQNLNKEGCNRLSIVVQDDTMVKSAELKLVIKHNHH